MFGYLGECSENMGLIVLSMILIISSITLERQKYIITANTLRVGHVITFIIYIGVVF